MRRCSIRKCSPRISAWTKAARAIFLVRSSLPGVYVDRDMARHLQGTRHYRQQTHHFGQTHPRPRRRDSQKRHAPQSVVVISPGPLQRPVHQNRKSQPPLAWGHARIIENLCEMKPDCPRALFRQIRRCARPRACPRWKRAKPSSSTNEPKAESDFAVAAASIPAREKFIDWLEDTPARQIGATLSRGVSASGKGNRPKDCRGWRQRSPRPRGQDALQDFRGSPRLAQDFFHFGRLNMPGFWPACADPPPAFPRCSGPDERKASPISR